MMVHGAENRCIVKFFFIGNSYGSKSKAIVCGTKRYTVGELSSSIETEGDI